MKNKHPKIFIICGKARHGKDTIGNIISDYYNKIGKKGIKLAYGSYIKEYAKNISDWDGNDTAKPRALLQELGTEVIRNQIDEMFFVKRLCNDLKVYSFYMDYITIPDGRFKEEIDTPRSMFDNVIVIRVNRPNFKSPLTKKQQLHPTETALDDYKHYDYVVSNDGTIEDLEYKIHKILEEVDSNES